MDDSLDRISLIPEGDDKKHTSIDDDCICKPEVFRVGDYEVILHRPVEPTPSLMARYEEMKKDIESGEIIRYVDEAILNADWLNEQGGGYLQ